MQWRPFGNIPAKRLRIALAKRRFARMPVRIVQSKQNTRLKELRRTLAQPSRDGGGLVGIEGPNLLAEALRANLRISTVFVASGHERLLDELNLPTEIEILQLPKELLDSALTTEAPQSIAALVYPPEWTWAHLCGDRKRAATLIVVLAGLQDPGNLGTIVRSAEAFGATGIVFLPGTVSAWNPKAVRASAGSIFRLPSLTATETDALAHLRAAGASILATAATAGQPVERANLAGPVALIIGNEGNGVPPELAAQADAAITIPCPGPVESLNAAVAASVLLYEASRQRAIESGAQKNHRGAQS
jgi:TrmH family RNA methyltransferase